MNELAIPEGPALPTLEEVVERRRILSEALRSGNYTQGFYRLREPNPDRFCPAGVACELSGLGSWYEILHARLAYRTTDGTNSYAPPEGVLRFYGWDANCAIHVAPALQDRVRDALGRATGPINVYLLNDDVRLSLSQIADCLDYDTELLQERAK